ncbi:MAG TPA: transcription elongation factor GreA [Clostridiaceae bacterium]|nr:transcription elongation factor GreA [Clostridiaceae bacterium]
MAEELYEMTSAGIAALQNELENRKFVQRSEIAERIKVALSFGDLSENSEYDDAKQEQGENEARIVEIEKILKNARVIEDSEISKTQVTLGSKVEIEDVETGDKETYILVSAKEEDILSGKISVDSPVGKAIMKKKKNQIAEVNTPSGVLKYKIIDISKP